MKHAMMKSKCSGKMTEMNKSVRYFTVYEGLEVSEKLRHRKVGADHLLYYSRLRKNHRLGITKQTVYRPNDTKFTKKNPNWILKGLS
jgi:hypothetical protein